MSDKLKSQHPIALALAEAQAEWKQPARNQTGQVGPRRYRYADLASVIQLHSKHLAPRGVALTQDAQVCPQPEPAVGWNVVVTTALKSADDSMETSLTMPVPMENPTPQQIGSALTYGRRYGLMSLLGVAAEDDDDGAAASTTQRPRRKTKRPAPKPKPQPRPPQPIGERMPPPPEDWLGPGGPEEIAAEPPEAVQAAIELQRPPAEPPTGTWRKLPEEHRPNPKMAFGIRVDRGAGQAGCEANVVSRSGKKAKVKLTQQVTAMADDQHEVWLWERRS